MKWDLTTQLFYGGQWQDAPAFTRESSDWVTAARGRADEQAGPVPSKLTATLDNRGGDYNPRNPASALFGLAGRNTPMRSYLGSPHLGASNASLSTATAQVAPSLTAPGNGLLICAWAAPDPAPTYTLPGSMTGSGSGGDSSITTIQGGRQNVTAGATGTRTATLSAARDYVAASILINGPTTWPTGTLAPAGTSITLDVVDPGDLWVIFTAFASPTGSAPPVTPAFPSDTDGGGWLLLADTDDQQVASNGVEYLRMKVWIKKCRTVNNSHTITLPDAASATTVSFVTRVPASTVVSDWDVRGSGELASWKPDRTVDFDPAAGQGSAWTKVEANGVLRRLGQGTPPAESALLRYIRDTASLAAYWPMEDGRDAVRFASGIPGGSNLDIIQQGGIDLAADDSLPGSAALPKTARNLDFKTVLLKTRAPLSGIANTLTVGFWMTMPDLGSLTTDFGQFASVVVWFQGGDVPSMLAQGFYDPSTGLDNWVADDGHGTHGTSVITTAHSQAWRRVRATFEQSGGSLRTRLWLDDALIGDVTNAATTLGTPVRIEVLLDAGTRSGARQPEYLPASVGHLAVWAGVVTPTNMLNAGNAWPGELAGDRFLRLCAEENIAGSLFGFPADTMPMGPQPVDTLVNLLTEIERTDAGMLYDTRGQVGLTYRTRVSLYNQTAALALDWTNGDVAPPLTPAIDDLPTRNDVTAKRDTGSNARAVQTTGPLNVNLPADDPDGVGRTKTQVDVNPVSDDDLSDLASWYLHLGTIDETRWPQVTVDLDASPALADAASAVDIGDRITLDNLPADLSPDLISLIVVGSVETVGSHRRTIAFNCIPEAAFRVAEADGTPRVDTDGTERQGTPITSGAGGVTFTITNGEFWTTDPADFPIPCVMGGERVTVTAIGAPSGNTQLFTMTRSVNGVVKSHPVGTKIHVVEPAYAAL